MSFTSRATSPSMIGPEAIQERGYRPVPEHSSHRDIAGSRNQTHHEDKHQGDERGRQRCGTLEKTGDQPVQSESEHVTGAGAKQRQAQAISDQEVGQLFAGSAHGDANSELANTLT